MRKMVGVPHTSSRRLAVTGIGLCAIALSGCGTVNDFLYPHDMPSQQPATYDRPPPAPPPGGEVPEMEIPTFIRRQMD